MTVSIRASLLFSALAMAALTAAFAAPGETSDDAKTPTQAPHWTYGGEGGPGHSGALAPGNNACTAGLQQSPVDLGDALPAKAPAPIPHWIATRRATIANTGHTLQVNIAGGGSITLDGKDYALTQFHFHHPSEHTIDGKAFPLEIHFVHAAKDGDLAVVGVMVEEGEANLNLGPLWSVAPTRQGEAQINANIDTLNFMPPVAGVFRYEGSLTPPCSETVHWTIMTTPVTASESQIAAFAQLFPHNARPVQPLNRRHILRTAG